MGGGKHGGYKSAEQRMAVHASRADGGKGNPNKMVSPLDFGVSGIFGRMGQNPSINALTNANAIASQQPMMANSMMAKPDMSQQVMTGSFDPLTQQIGMGIFGDQNARNMAVRGSGIMMHDEEKIKRLEAEISDIQANGENSKFVNEGEDYQEAITDRQSDILEEKKKHKE